MLNMEQLTHTQILCLAIKGAECELRDAEDMYDRIRYCHDEDLVEASVQKMRDWEAVIGTLATLYKIETGTLYG